MRSHVLLFGIFDSIQCLSFLFDSEELCFCWNSFSISVNPMTYLTFCPSVKPGILLIINDLKSKLPTFVAI